MKRVTCNGWSSEATWAVAAWFTTEANLAQARKNFILRCPRLTGKSVRGFVTGLLSEGTPAINGLTEVIGRVNWAEIAEAWRTDRDLAIKR